MKIKLITFFSILLCNIGEIYAQKVDLAAPITKITTDKYRIEDVCDLSNISETNNFPSKIAFLEFTQKVYQNPKENAVTIVLKIKDLALKEKKGERLINGEIILLIQYLAIYNGDSVEVFNCKTGAKYQRNNFDSYPINIANLLSQITESNLKAFDKFIVENNHKIEAFAKKTVLNILPFRTDSSNDTLFYQNGKVSWTDFKGEVPYSSNFAAAIFPSFSLETTFRVDSNTIYCHILPSVFMIPTMSWVRDGQRNSNSLAHEQGHFDISYIAIQELLAKIKKYPSQSINELHAYIQYEYLLSMQQMNKMQEKYDEDTKHGIYPNEQNEWYQKIARIIEKNDGL